MMYRLTKHRGEGDSLLRFALFPIRDANFLARKHQFGYAALYVLVQILNQSIQKPCGYLRALPFLRATVCWDSIIRMPKNE
jgi:hypothetical protein